jgi:hypothetical protein
MNNRYPFTDLSESVMIVISTILEHICFFSIDLLLYFLL